MHYVFFAYSQGPEFEPILFIGRTNGKIVSPRGRLGFGWDPIFQPDNYDKTFGEMTQEEKNRVSPRYKAIQELSKYI